MIAKQSSELKCSLGQKKRGGDVSEQSRGRRDRIRDRVVNGGYIFEVYQ
jgi:hypothetical protein